MDNFPKKTVLAGWPPEHRGNAARNRWPARKEGAAGSVEVWPQASCAAVDLALDFPLD